jgi:hypothetical protein
MRHIASSSSALAHHWCRHLTTAYTTLALTIATGCTTTVPHRTAASPRSATAAASPDPDSATAAIAADTDWIRTPAGLSHRSCVHEIPAGAVVGVDNVVRRRDGTSYTLPPCLFPGHSSIPRELRYGASNPSTTPPMPVSAPTAPTFVARVVTAHRDTATGPMGPHSLLDLVVAIAPATVGNAGVIVGAAAWVYIRHGTQGLSIAAADSIVTGDELEVWHDGSAAFKSVHSPPGTPAYVATRIVIRR